MNQHITEWIARHGDGDRPLIPAATVLLVRDGADGLETLMMRRSSELSFAQGMWVFPGGRIDPADYADGVVDEAGAAANAAIREAKEEAGLEIDPACLLRYSHWIPPVEAPKRFSTWFFVAPAPAGDVTVDLGEILEHAWWRPSDALERAHRKQIEILPPTWMSLNHMTQFGSAEQLLDRVRHREPARFAVRILETPDGRATMWERDAAYRTGDPNTPGPRHRLVMADPNWRLEDW